MLILSILLGSCRSSAESDKPSAELGHEPLLRPVVPPLPEGPVNGENRCLVSFQWSVGEIDERFMIDREDVIRLMEEAIQLWSGALDEFETSYDEHRGIRLRFVYDERQELTDNERQFQERVRARRAEIDALEQEYDQLVEQFEQRSEQFRRQATEIEQRIEALNRWIRERNEAGGLMEDNVSRLETEKEEIEQLQQEEHSNQQALNAFAEEIDGFRERLNRAIDENNQMIEFYNREYAGENHFTSGRYEHVAGKKNNHHLPLRRRSGSQARSGSRTGPRSWAEPCTESCLHHA